ncbi:MAG: glycine cleavage T C-terminal barrel domain-containing protein, partial [Candidatus Hydrogenedentes bacterium]|nr:glycine cleavage T C-terminal barrel domain-containing protein [Candidatus Hydrogenedentota bacterium]
MAKSSQRPLPNRPEVNTSIDGDVTAVRRKLGAWIRDTHAFIRIEGNDVATWLQSQTSNDVVALQPGQGHANTILDRKGRLQAHFTVHRWDDEFWLIVENQQKAALLKQLDDHLFLEDVQIHDATEEVEQLVVQGPRTRYFLASLLTSGDASDNFPGTPYGCHPIEIAGHQMLAFQISETGEDGFVLVTQQSEARPLLDKFLEAGRKFDLREISPEAQNVLRVEAGIPRFGIDMDITNRLPETTLERDAVSYDKGCYLGQEVIAKLRTYSSVKHAVVGLVLEVGEFPPINTRLHSGAIDIGILKSSAFSPMLETPIALAYIDRDHRAPGTLLELNALDAKPFRARVVVLPFHHPLSRIDRARMLYDNALNLFDRDARDEDDTAIELLREAVLLDPKFEDAYEALGVILNRHHRVDEAIHYMTILERLNPDSVMAHTNLSVFYVAKGMIEAAEEEKAKAAVLQMKHARVAREAEDIAAAERERIQREARERIAMFAEVLEFDPDDPLAT